MHGLLAISALHLSYSSASSEQKTKHMLQSLQHHSEALRMFVPHLEDVDSSNADACFAVGCIISMMNTFSIAEIHRTGHLVEPSDVVQAFHLLRGR